MEFASYLVLLAVGLLVVGQTVAVSGFVRSLTRFRKTSQGSHQKLSDKSLPTVAVILSLRGPDPFLGGTLKALTSLDYPDYEVHLIVDSETDPVWKDIRSALADCDSKRVQIQTLKNVLPTCSLKCSSLVQAIQSLHEQVEVVAFVDGDAVPHRLWLKDLVTPLVLDSSVGVVTGNRWFVPRNLQWGTLVRYFWNVGAVVQVWLNGIVWAGSMAMRRDVIDRIELLDAWSKALSVDATICRQLRKHRLKVQFAPTVMMANREDIGLAKFVGWVQRQLVAAKSCGPNWRIVALHAFSLTGSQIAALILVILAAATGNQQALIISLCAMAIYWISAAVSTVADQ